MKKNYIIFLLFISVSIFSQSDDPLLKAYLNNFEKGPVATKIQILQDASKLSGRDMGELYLRAVNYILNNSDMLSTDPLLKEMTILAVRLIGISEYKPAANTLWRLFDSEESTSVRVEIMNSLGNIAQDNSNLINSMNVWMTNQNTLYRGGDQIDQQVIGECVVTLGKLNNENSFFPIFTATVLNYPEFISDKAETALNNIEGDFATLIVQVITNGFPDEKTAALNASLKKSDLTLEQKSLVAEKALDVGIRTSALDSKDIQALRELRYTAARALTEYKWSKASPLAIANLDMTILEYDRSATLKTNLLEAIACLGAMGTHEAAVRLTLYLELTNSYKEDGRKVDEQILLAVVVNLGLLGDSIALEDLLYTQYLDYSNKLINAVKEAIDQL